MIVNTSVLLSNIFSQSTIFNLTTAKFALTVLGIKEDNTVRVGQLGEDDLLVILVLDHGHSKRVGTSSAILTGNNISKIVARSLLDLNLEAVGLQ